eukprot:14110552-Alexandrium_andersonii.AAC.1
MSAVHPAEVTFETPVGYGGNHLSPLIPAAQSEFLPLVEPVRIAHSRPSTPSGHSAVRPTRHRYAAS